MATTNFYLISVNPKGTIVTAKDKLYIYMFFHFDGQRLKFPTGESIESKHWNIDGQRVKKTLTGSPEINDGLDNLQETVNKLYRTAKNNNETLTTSILKDRLLIALNKIPINTEKPKVFFDYLDEFIEVNKASKRARTIQKYNTLKKHLQAFEKIKKYPLSFQSIDAKFYESYVAFYVTNLKVLNNTVGKYIGTLKTFMHWATSRGYNTGTSFEKFKATKTDADIIYLTEEELMHLYYFDLSNNKRLSQVRDSFCFGCFTGLRFSDIERVTKESVKGDELHISSYKTKESIVIPLNDFSKAILERNEYKLHTISNQKTNEYLKELGKKAEINEPVTLVKHRGAEEVVYSEPKYNFISSHTARRTFVTLSLEKGMRPETVMSITGHKEYKTFKKYIKLTDKVKKEEMHRVWNTDTGRLKIA